MPMNRKLYPKNWNAIARKVKDKAFWTCQECQRPCRPPSKTWEQFEDWVMEEHPDWWPDFYEEVIHRGVLIEEFRKNRFTLTVAHLNHDPSDNRPENLKALCSVCHLEYDKPKHIETRKERRRKKLEDISQLPLFKSKS